MVSTMGKARIGSVPKPLIAMIQGFGEDYATGRKAFMENCLPTFSGR